MADFEKLEQAVEKNEASQAQEKAEQEQKAALRELHDHVRGFQKASAQWREASWEDKWHAYRRMADSTYDPVLKAKKESWQSTAFIPVAPSHRETIQAALYRVLFGPRPMMEVRPRPFLEKDTDQSENIKDMILREIERTSFEAEGNSVLDDATTYGSGFLRVRWEHEQEERLIREAVVEGDPQEDPEKFADAIAGEGLADAFDERLEAVTTYRGVKAEWLDTWDVFPDPDSIRIKGSPIARRFYINKDRIKRLIDEDKYLPEALDGVEGESSQEGPTQSESETNADRRISEEKVERTKGGEKVEAFEHYERLPQKWVFWDRPEMVTDPEKLIPAVVHWHQGSVMAVEPSTKHDGEPPIYKMDYMSVNGQFYGRGVIEMLIDLQNTINETINQRIDNISLVLNKSHAVIEEGITNPDELRSRPNGYVRISARKLQANGIPADIRAAYQAIEIPDVAKSSFADPQEMERYAQERTSANRTTLGTAGQVRDANQTLGGMEILRQAAGEKFAYIGTLAEFKFLRKVFAAIWQELYSNIEPQDVVDAIGEERAQRFQLLTPEQIDQDYRYEPQGIFTMETRALRQARLQSLHQQFAGAPWLSDEKVFDQSASAADLDPESLKRSPEEIELMTRAQAQMAGQMGPEGDPNTPLDDSQEGEQQLDLPPGGGVTPEGPVA